jgi:hypothetical protein
MTRLLASIGCGVLALGAQEPSYFTEAAASPWRPSGELRLELDRLPSIEADSGETDHRFRALLQAGWTADWLRGRWDLAVRGALGSDGNQRNILRYDQHPSNGAWLHRASVRFETNREQGFASITAGLQDNALLAQESLWDRDLGVLGLGLRAAFRNEGRGLAEAGLRAVAGRVRTFPGAAVDLRAVQAVVRGENDAVAWSAHAAWWEIRWDAGEHRFAPVRGPGARQALRFEALGAGLAGHQGWGWELRAYAHRNRSTGGTGTEIQAWLGPVRRPLRPRLGLVHQRYGETGTAPPVNGDEWWFVRGARGPRAILQLPFRGGWLASLSHLAHRRDGEAEALPRTVLSLTCRF